MVTVEVSKGQNALFWNIQLNYRAGLKPLDHVLIWASNRYAFDHNPIEREISEKPKADGKDAIDQNLEGDPFISYFCEGGLDVDGQLESGMKFKDYTGRVDPNFVTKNNEKDFYKELEKIKLPQKRWNLMKQYPTDKLGF